MEKSVRPERADVVTRGGLPPGAGEIAGDRVGLSGT